MFLSLQGTVASISAIRLAVRRLIGCCLDKSDIKFLQECHLKAKVAASVLCYQCVFWSISEGVLERLNSQELMVALHLGMDQELFCTRIEFSLGKELTSYLAASLKLSKKSFTEEVIYDL